MLDPLRLSYLLVAVPILYSAYQFFYGDRKRALVILSTYLFMSAVVLPMKFILKAPRPGGAETVDPYSFPSYHATYAALFFFMIPNILTLLYAVLVGYLRIAAGVHSGVDVIGGYILAGVLWWLFRKGRERVGREWDRQAFHMGTGALLGLLLYNSWQLGLLLMILALIFGLILYRWREHPWISAFLEFFDRDGTGRGAFAFLFGSAVATALNPSFGWVAVWYLSYVDAAATIAGKYFGTKGKSAYGFIAGFLAGVLIALATDTPLWFAPIAAAVEYLSPIDDNLMIPVVVALLGWMV